MFAERTRERLREHRPAVFYPLPVAYHDLVAFEVDILEAQAKEFHQAQAGSIHQAGHESRALSRSKSFDSRGGATLACRALVFL